MENRIIYLNGKFLPQDEAVISVFDWGFSGGDGVYEATRTFGQKLFRLDDHLKRLERSLTYARIDCKIDPQELKSLSIEAVNRNIQLIDETPRIGAEGLLIAFLHPKSTHGVLVELCQSPK